MNYPEYLVKNQVLYQCYVLCDWNLSFALRWIVLVRIIIRLGQAAGMELIPDQV